MRPNIKITTGFYLDNPGCAYFFAGKDSDDRNMYHEATHQLFHESRLVAPNVGHKTNFWIVEGIAMYMESLAAGGRLRRAGRFRRRAGERRPLSAAARPFLRSAWRVRRFRHGETAKRPANRHVYSQAAGLTHFLIYYDDARYRDALVSYLSAVYAGHDNHDTLARLTGASYSDLDKQYREFLEGKKLRKTAADEPPPADSPSVGETKK